MGQVGFSWTLSYNQWIALFKALGWTLEVVKAPKTESFSGHKTLSACVEVKSGKIKLILDFNYKDAPDVTSLGSLYSLTVNLIS
jgi:hypothetical protein